MLLHVIDLADPRYEHKIAVVNEVLTNLGADHKPTIYVFNKTDLLPIDFDYQVIAKKFERFNPCFTSTYQQKGLAELIATIEKTL